MQRLNKRIFLILIILVSFSAFLKADDRRVIPLDMYLIIDGSEFFRDVKNDVTSWLNGHLVDRILAEGDKVTIWVAGENAQIIYSDEIPTGENALDRAKQEIKARLDAIDASGGTANFAGALSALEPRLAGTPADRLAYSVLVTSSAVRLERAISGNSLRMLRWSRSEKYERWQALVIAPTIGPRANQAAAAFMNFTRQ